MIAPERFNYDLTQKPQSPNEARQMANIFVREEIRLAQEYNQLGLRDLAMVHLGFALHTVQDSTSDEHHNFQMWSGEEWTVTKIFHGIRESYDLDPVKSNFAHATRDVIDWFTGGQALPNNSVDIFSRYGEDKFLEHQKWKAQKLFNAPDWL